MIVANWKMNGSIEKVEQFIVNLQTCKKCILCLPYVFIYQANDIIKKTGGKNIVLGAQDCSKFKSGSYTGDISATMLKSMGCEYVILGHSERRKHHNETNDIVRKKAVIAIDAGLVPIICIGDSSPIAKKSELTAQIKEIFTKNEVGESFVNSTYIIAYEPIYAIGAKKAPSIIEINESMEIIKSQVDKEVFTLYGGSVDENNAHTILAINNLKGLLIGRASLELDTLNAILSQ